MDAHIIQTLAISAIPIIFAITLHEAAHGYVALRFGDNTALRLGRISLNPAHHIDPFGTIILPAMLMLLSGGNMLFGWAKPVPVNYGNLRKPKRDMVWVAAAGPLANLLMAFIWALLLKVTLISPVFAYTEALQEMSQVGITMNVSLMVLNLLPILPLDGGRILNGLLPVKLAWKHSQTESYGLFIVIALMATHLLQKLMLPPFMLLVALIATLFQL
jgi:Zn-dependent protease